jgi:hypothetical protein
MLLKSVNKLLLLYCISTVLQLGADKNKREGGRARFVKLRFHEVVDGWALQSLKCGG